MSVHLILRRCLITFLFAAMPPFAPGMEASSPESPAAAADTFIEWTRNNTPMGLYLPANRSDGLPIVMFLHGCHNNPVSPYHWIIAALNAIEPCAVFLPTAPETENTPYTCADWGGTYDAALRPQMTSALHQLDSLINVYKFDTGRQYLYGESMGGEGVYRLLADFPSRFAGAVNAAGYTINKGAAKMAQTPLWIFIGSEDEMSPVDSSRSIYRAILDAGGAMVDYTEYPGLSHVGGIEKAREEPGVLAWLLTRRRPTEAMHQPSVRNRSVSPEPPVRYVNGHLCFSSQPPRGTIVSLFALNGQLLWKTDVREKNCRLPSYTANRVVFWSVANSHLSVSGKTFLRRQ